MSASESPAISLSNVTKVFRDFWFRPRVTAVNDLSLSIARGEAFGLLGPNGSGKSTTIKLVLGLLFPTSGDLRVLGRPATDVALKERIGYLPEDSTLYRFLNAKETLDFYGRLFHLPRRERRRRSDELIEMVGLSGAVGRPVAEYSKGMQRRLGLAQALINDPDLLILDEPTAGMDPEATGQIKEYLKALRGRGKTIILCTHLLSEVEDVCSRLAILYGGQLLSEGPVDELLRQADFQNIRVDLLAPETLEKVRCVVEEEAGKRVLTVENPRLRLEELFLRVVKTAEAEGQTTAGASGQGQIAAFLAGTKPEPGSEGEPDAGAV